MKPTLRTGLALGLLLAAVAADAQSSLDPSSILAATPSGDTSTQMLRYVFGGFATNPFALASSSTLLGNIFLYLNSFIFFIAALWSTYTIVSSIVSTAHEGEFLGKRYSTVWYPIRLVWGAGTLVPVFGGFSLGQAIYMFFTLISIGGANLIANQAITSVSQFTSMVSAPASQPASSQLDGSLADQLFADMVCADSIASESQTIVSGAGMPSPLANVQGTPINSGSGAAFTTIGTEYGTPDAPDACGSVAIALGNSGQTSSTTLGFSTNAVNYSGITQTIQANVLQAHQSALAALSTAVKAQADAWFTAYAQNKVSGTPITAYPAQQLAAARAAYDSAVQQQLSQAVSSSGTQALTSQAIQSMTSIGWAGLGSWYETFAEVNGAIADAAKVNFTMSGPSTTDSVWLDTQGALKQARSQALDPAGLRYGDSAGRDASGSGLALSYLEQQLCDNTTGNLSLGQCLLHTSQWALFQNTGGQQLVDPIIAAKNLGDYLMVGGETLFGLSAMASLVDDSSKSLTGTIISGAADVATDGLASQLKSAFVKVGGMLHVIAMPLIVIGMVMSIYIPLIPFISWFSALLTWFSVIVEAIIAAPIWSMAHAEGDGEGMGQRSQHGYLFLVNVIFRAPLMVVSFFVASATTIILGTVLYQFFGSAVANAAGNSMVGLLSIVGYLIVLCCLMILVVQTSFNLVHVIPDQVLGWIGGNLGATLGRELEGRANNVIVASIKQVQGGMAGGETSIPKVKPESQKSERNGRKAP